MVSKAHNHDVAQSLSDIEQKLRDVVKASSNHESIRESAVGKGLSGALQLLRDHGSLKDTVECSGRYSDKKKSKLAGLVNESHDKKEIRIERTDEYGKVVSIFYNF